MASVAADRRAELVVAGRTSAATLRWLETAAHARVRALVEERGMRAASVLAQAGDRSGPGRSPASMLGLLLDRDGPASLGGHLERLGDAAVVDSRVLLAHRFGADERDWPPAEDRFASDLLLPDRVADPWLRDLTASVVGARIPVALGGHTLVGPGLRLLLANEPMDLSAGLRREPPIDLEEVGENDALAARIRAEIEATGPMTFARFMELALYDPDGGYYRGAEPRPGRSGDFLTAPEAHPIFGQAVANQLVEVWERLDRPAPFVVREHGAGSGTLAEAILSRLERARPELLAVLRYVPIEIDTRRVDAFGERLSAAGFADRIAPAGDDRPFTGVVLANEVLDALPVHRIGVRDGSLAERFVESTPTAVLSTPGPAVDAGLGERLRADGVRLAEGQSGEVCLALDRWIAEAVQSLERGLLLLIDYGALASELYDAARRPQGTVRAFARHRVSDDLYGHIGRQDLTAHVDLTALAAAVTAVGLTPVGVTTQAESLIGIGVEARLEGIQADPATTLRTMPSCAPRSCASSTPPAWAVSG